MIKNEGRVEKRLNRGVQTGADCVTLVVVKKVKLYVKPQRTVSTFEDAEIHGGEGNDELIYEHVSDTALFYGTISEWQRVSLSRELSQHLIFLWGCYPMPRRRRHLLETRSRVYPRPDNGWQP